MTAVLDSLHPCRAGVHHDNARWRMPDKGKSGPKGKGGTKPAGGKTNKGGKGGR